LQIDKEVLLHFPIPRISFTTPEKERKRLVEEFKGMYYKWIKALASNSVLCQNNKHEKAGENIRYKTTSAEPDKVAEGPRRYKHSQESLSGKGSGVGGEVHGVREGASEYKPPEGDPGEDSTRPLNSTRYFETSQGIKSYSEVSEIIAVSVAKAIESIIDKTPAILFRLKLPPAETASVEPEEREDIENPLNWNNGKAKNYYDRIL
jgi:hypothetical protein